MTTRQHIDDDDILSQMQGSFDDAIEGKPLDEEVVGDPTDKIESEEMSDETVTEETVEQDDDKTPDLQAQLDAERQRNELLQKEIEARGQTEEESEETEQQQETKYQDPFEKLSNDDRDFLDNYKTDWPDVFKAEEMHRTMLAERVSSLVIQVSQHFQNQIDALNQTIQGLTEVANKQTISSKLDGDVDAIMSDVEKWIETQPAFLQPQYKRVAERGSVEEKLALIDYYKSQTKKTPSVSDKTSSKQQHADVTHLNPVVTKRTSKVTTDETDPFDFQGAFNEALQKVGASK